MCFMFYILILINCLSYSSNYVLKRVNSGEDGIFKSNDDHVILQENRTNTRSSNLKVNIFDQRLSDEMFSLKQSIYGEDNPAKFKSTKNNIGTPTIDIHEKWPAVDLLSKPDEIEENEHNVDDFDFRHLFPQENDNVPSGTENSESSNEGQSYQPEHTVINIDNFEEPQNKSKDKNFDLRSLTSHAPLNKNVLRQKPSSNHCSCTRSLINSNWAPGYDRFGHPFASKALNKCGGCYKTSVSYTLMPFYIPYDPYMYQPPYIIKDDNKKVTQEAYDDDTEIESESDDDSDDEDYDKYKKPVTKKNKKKSKGYKENIVIDIDYDTKPREPEVKWNTAFFEGRPNKLVNDLIDDLLMLYPDSAIRKCYCSSSSINFSESSYVVLFLFILMYFS